MVARAQRSYSPNRSFPAEASSSLELGPSFLSACVHRNASVQAQVAHSKAQKFQWLPSSQDPSENPPELVQEYMDIIEELLKAPTQEEAGKEQKREVETWSDPDFLNYMDELCFQEDFVIKVALRVMGGWGWSRHME